jgi:hypothetical protein
VVIECGKGFGKHGINNCSCLLEGSKLERELVTREGHRSSAALEHVRSPCRSYGAAEADLDFRPAAQRLVKTEHDPALAPAAAIENLALFFDEPFRRFGLGLSPFSFLS